MSTTQQVSVGSEVSLRRARPEDAAECGRICYEAFANVNRDHNFPPDFPNVEVPRQILSGVFSHPGFYCVVAELDGRIAGSNCMDERNSIAGIGPITIDPAVQNRNVGKRLMLDVMRRAEEKKFAGVRLVQAAFHNRSLSLYAKLGFDVREPLAVMQGPAIGRQLPGYTVRAAREADLAACNDICRSVHGHERGGELRDAIAQGTATVAEFNGVVTAYATSLAFFGHAVARNNADLQALIAAAWEFGGPGILVPTRNAELFRWCLTSGLRVVEPMTLMSVGLYNEPAGAWLPSILY